MRGTDCGILDCPLSVAHHSALQPRVQTFKSRILQEINNCSRPLSPITHDDCPTIRVDNLVFTRAELGRLSSRRRRVAWVQNAFREGHDVDSSYKAGGVRAAQPAEPLGRWRRDRRERRCPRFGKGARSHDAILLCARRVASSSDGRMGDLHSFSQIRLIQYLTSRSTH